MKAILLLVLMGLLMPACTYGPSVTRTPKGGYHASVGGTLAARRQNVVAEVVTREGDTIRFSTTDEDSTAVPSTYIGWKGAAKIAKIRQPIELKATEDVTATELGAQSVQKNKDTLDAGIESLKLKPTE